MSENEVYIARGAHLTSLGSAQLSLLTHNTQTRPQRSDSDDEKEVYEVLMEIRTPCTVRALRWCPTMDLFLLLARKGDVSVYRRKTEGSSDRKVDAAQKINVLKYRSDCDDDSEEDGDGKGESKGGEHDGGSLYRFSSVCWKQDGKQFAVARFNGCIQLHDVMQGTGAGEEDPSSARKDRMEAYFNACGIHKAAVRHLKWVEGSALDERSKSFFAADRTLRNFLQLRRPPIASAFSRFSAHASGAPERPVERESRPCRNRLDVLVSADDDGVIQLRAFGLLLVASVQIKGLIGPHPAQFAGIKRPTVLGASLSSDLGSLMAHVRCAQTGNAAIVACDSSILNSRKAEICAVAHHLCEMSYLLSYIEGCIVNLKSRWAEGRTPFMRKLRALSAISVDAGEGSDVNVDVEMMHMLVTGVPSDILKTFMLEYVQKERIKIIRSKIDVAATAVLEVLADNLHPAAEQLAFRAGDLRGLARCSEDFRPIGLAQMKLDDLVEAAGAVLAKVEEMRKVAVETRFRFQKFFDWFTDTWMRLNIAPEDYTELRRQPGHPNIALAHTAACIREDLTRNRLGQYFTDEPLSSAHGGSIPARPATASKAGSGKIPYPVVGLMPKGVIKRWKVEGRLSLKQAFESIRGLFKDAIGAPARAISEQIFASSVVRLPSPVKISSASNSLVSLREASDVRVQYAALARLSTKAPTDDSGALVHVLKFERRSQGDTDEHSRPLGATQGSPCTLEVSSACVRYTLPDENGLDKSSPTRIVGLEIYDGDRTSVLLTQPDGSRRQPRAVLCQCEHASVEYTPLAPERGDAKRSGKQVGPRLYTLPNEGQADEREVERSGFIGQPAMVGAEILSVCSGRDVATVVGGKRILAVLTVGDEDDESGDEQDESGDEQNDSENEQSGADGSDEGCD